MFTIELEPGSLSDADGGDVTGLNFRLQRSVGIESNGGANYRFTVTHSTEGGSDGPRKLGLISYIDPDSPYSLAVHEGNVEVAIGIAQRALEPRDVVRIDQFPGLMAGSTCSGVVPPVKEALGVGERGAAEPQVHGADIK